MIDLAAKNKINLEDYDSKKDIFNRNLLTQLTDIDLEVLEEILYNPPVFPVSTICRNLEISADDLVPTLEKLGSSGLFVIDGDTMTVDKETRRYFESMIEVFEEDYSPGMDYLQSLLKRVPIHILPTWYQIPRTSNNIFESLIEKYLHTPQTFQRYLMELGFADDVIPAMIEDVFSSKELKLSSKEIMDKYDLSAEEFRSCILQLEFNFVLTITYERNGNHWDEYVTPFKEWREYLLFMRSTEANPIENESDLELFRNNEYAFVDDMAALLKVCQVRELSVVYDKENNEWTADPEQLPLIADACEALDLSKYRDRLVAYLPRLISKVCQIHLAEISDNKLIALPEANEWIHLPSEKRAHSTYKHPLNSPNFNGLDKTICSERNVRAVEKSINRIADQGWVYFDEFLRGVTVPLNEETETRMKKVGRTWRYTIPQYTEAQKAFIESMIIEWLFEAGIVRMGEHKGRVCFCTTSLGKSLFGQ